MPQTTPQTEIETKTQTKTQTRLGLGETRMGLAGTETELCALSCGPTAFVPPVQVGLVIFAAFSVLHALWSSFGVITGQAPWRSAVTSSVSNSIISALSDEQSAVRGWRRVALASQATLCTRSGN